MGPLIKAQQPNLWSQFQVHAGCRGGRVTAGVSSVGVGAFSALRPRDAAGLSLLLCPAHCPLPARTGARSSLPRVLSAPPKAGQDRRPKECQLSEWNSCLESKPNPLRVPRGRHTWPHQTLAAGKRSCIKGNVSSEIPSDFQNVKILRLLKKDPEVQRMAILKIKGCDITSWLQEAH